MRKKNINYRISRVLIPLNFTAWLQVRSLDAIVIKKIFVAAQGPEELYLIVQDVISSNRRRLES